MNSLSLLIYAVELVSNIGATSVVFTWLGAILFVVLGFIRIVFYFDEGIKDIEFRKQATAFLRWWHRAATAVLVVSVIGQVFMPTRQTAVMIAASEVAEVVIKSEEAKTVMKDVTGLGQDAVGLLKTYIQTEQKKLMDELKPAEPKKDTTNT